jgi:DNA-binding NtrC family response regulator
MNHACRVYVVDDEPMIASTLATILIDHGYEAIFFTDPLEVLAIVAQGAPAFLISDVTMPGLTGIELALKVLEHCPSCRVFLMTAMDSIDVLLEAAGATTGKFPLFHKPFHPGTLLDAMKSVACPQIHATK